MNKTVRIYLAMLTLLIMTTDAMSLDGRGFGICVTQGGRNVPCSVGSSGGGRGYSVDPGYQQMIREQRRQEEEERKRKLEARRRYEKPYRGIEYRQKDYEKFIGNTLHRLSVSEATVKGMTRQMLPGGRSSIFVPGGYGDILLAQPVNATSSETQVSSEQLEKVAAVLSFMQDNTSSTEDQHFLSSQAAAIMIGQRSYVHVTVRPYKHTLDVPADQVSGLLRSIETNQAAIIDSEAARGKVLENAKAEIKEYTLLFEEIKNVGESPEREKLEEKIRQSRARLDAYEKEYFRLDAGEKQLKKNIEQAARILREKVIWKK